MLGAICHLSWRRFGLGLRRGRPAGCVERVGEICTGIDRDAGFRRVIAAARAPDVAVDLGGDGGILPVAGVSHD